MKTIGIIAEYNPFHNGHLYHIDKIKEQYKDRYEEFYNRFCCVDDGHAARRVVEKVFK